MYTVLFAHGDLEEVGHLLGVSGQYNQQFPHIAPMGRYSLASRYSFFFFLSFFFFFLVKGWLTR